MLSFRPPLISAADLGEPNRIDVYYGMADSRIGVARTYVPEELPVEASADYD